MRPHTDYLTPTEGPELSSNLYEIRNKLQMLADHVESLSARLHRKNAQLISLDGPKVRGIKPAEAEGPRLTLPLISEVNECVIRLESELGTLAMIVSETETI